MNYVCFPHSSCFVCIFFGVVLRLQKTKKPLSGIMFMLLFSTLRRCLLNCVCFCFSPLIFFPAIYVTNILWNSVLHGCHLNKITISHTALVFCANMSVNVYLRNVSKSREQQTSLCFYQFDLATSFYYDYFFGGSNKK